MVRLPDDLEGSGSVRSSVWKNQLNLVINAARIYNVPVINITIVAVLGFFLVKLTTKYKEMYMKSSLVTIIVTNLVLYGISETLAQSILSFNLRAATISLQFSEPRDLFENGASDDSVTLTTQPGLPHEDFEDPGSGDSDIDDENLDTFLSYLRSDTSLPYQTVPSAGDPAEIPPELSFFKFNRLAGFMCWGFVMAFVQCWWYGFLQIYSKHPQFVEVLRKVMSDQFCFSPISLFCFFTYGTIVLENGTWGEAKAKLQKLYLQTLVINYCVWFPVQFVNFLLVPRDFQVPFSSSVSVLWNCFLSMRNSTS